MGLFRKHFIDEQKPEAEVVEEVKVDRKKAKRRAAESENPTPLDEAQSETPESSGE